MKEQLYTIPLMDAFREQDECPFCFIHRSLEQHALDFSLSPSTASYMEDDLRSQTDKMGFCQDHYNKMFAYGNRLGSALILETHLRKKTAELKNQLEHFSKGEKPSLIDRLKKTPAADEKCNNVTAWIREQNKSCYICDQIQTTYERYLATFFELFKRNEDEFMELLTHGKGFCLPHFGDILAGAERYLSEKDQERLRGILFPQMIENLNRIIDDVEWFQKKFDYQFRDADWKNSKDAVQRAMQKAAGGYPADPPHTQK